MPIVVYINIPGNPFDVKRRYVMQYFFNYENELLHVAFLVRMLPEFFR